MMLDQANLVFPFLTLDKYDLDFYFSNNFDYCNTVQQSLWIYLNKAVELLLVSGNKSLSIGAKMRQICKAIFMS